MNRNAVQFQQPVPRGLPQQQVGAAFNNALAQAYASGDPRFNMKQLDRAGFSRGAGQQAQAGISAANNVADGVARAYGDQLQNNAYNAASMLRANQEREAFAQALGGFGAQQHYANQMAALQRQQAGLSLVGSILGGLLN